MIEQEDSGLHVWPVFVLYSKKVLGSIPGQIEPFLCMFPPGVRVSGAFGP